MELETVNKLYLELSQIATAKTKREIELDLEVVALNEKLKKYECEPAFTDLLEALEGLKSQIILSDIPHEYVESHFKNQLDKATAAIAKAKGDRMTEIVYDTKQKPLVKSLARLYAIESGLFEEGREERLICNWSDFYDLTDMLIDYTRFVEDHHGIK